MAQISTQQLLEEVKGLRSLCEKQFNEIGKLNSFPELRRVLIPRIELMQFLNYGATQMAAFAKAHQLSVLKCGKRVFYYKIEIYKILGLDISDSSLNKL